LKKRLKKIKEAYEERKKRGLSLSIKWTLASSFFIFVVFTVFAAITYKSTVSSIVSREKENLHTTVEEIARRLENNTGQLTFSNSVHSLTESSEYPAAVDNSGDAVANNIFRLDSFVSELSQADLKVFIYNTNQELVFETKNSTAALKQTKDLAPTIETLEGETGILEITAVRSKKTKQPIGHIQAFYELKTVKAIQKRLVTTLIILEAVAFLLSAALGYLLSSYFLKPVKVLRDTMEAIRKNPEEDIHAPVINTRDELADLSEIFNEMIDRMRRYIEQQEQFVEDVSHELRTPVAIIEGHLKLLTRWGKEDPEVLDESLSASLQEISRMKTLVQEMLDLSRAEQVDIQYRDKTAKAKEVIHQVYNNFQLLYPEFTFNLDDDLDQEVDVAIYRDHFEQIMIIILDNAVKYSSKRKEIHISDALEGTGRYLEIAIQDFGEGIPSKELKRIFDRFYRVDKARSRNQGGNGLGLSIAQQLVENYKGNLQADSVLGEGTVFRIFLPLAKHVSEE
jgi:signal transduction histidine kinase